MKRVAARLRTFLSGMPAYWVAAAVVVGVVVLAVVGIIGLVVDNANTQLRDKDTQIASRDATIAGLNQKLFLLGNAYAAVRDQEYSLGIPPAAGTLTQVENPGAPGVSQVTPKSFTVAIPDAQIKGGVLYFTCTDKTGAGNFVCAPATPPAGE